MKVTPRRKPGAKSTSTAPAAERRRLTDQPAPELIFFTGKGGVGKTTIAASYAVWRASSSRERVLLISTDPAHSLGDIFERRLPPKPVALKIGNRAALTIHEINAEKRFNRFLVQYRDPLLSAIESGTMFTREEIEPLLSSTLPGMSEIAALLATDDAVGSGDFDCIVVDTAPFGHTLRLFQLPEAFQKLVRFLEVASSRDAILAAHFGGRVPPQNPLLAEWQAVLQSLLIDLRRRARLVLVTTAEPFALQESERVSETMRSMKPALRFSDIVLNRAVIGRSACMTCNAQHKAARKARLALANMFPKLPVRIAADSGAPILGVRMLLQFGQNVFGGKRNLPRAPAAPRAAMARLRVTEWPAISEGLSITVGKGGVGKTTISAAIAVLLRRREQRSNVAVCSTDPAPSLDDVFEEDVNDKFEPIGGDARLLAAEIDAPVEFHAWAARMNESIAGALTSSSSGLHVDLSFERQLFSALLDVVPPGLDEVFAVLRVSSLLRQKTAGHLILDMTPTGHALELLRTPDRILHWSRLLLKSLAQHRTLPFARDIGAEIAKFSSDVRWLTQCLRSAKATAAWIVMLAEPLPDRETARLLRSLQSLKVPVGGIIVNRLLLDTCARCARCRLRASWQANTLARLKKGVFTALPIYCASEQEHGISGRTALERFTKQIWRLA